MRRPPPIVAHSVGQDQPRPRPSETAAMTTSSHYASPQSPHYHAFSSHNDMYASVAAWQAPDFSPESGPSSAVPQRFSVPAQRPYPSTYFHYAGAVDHDSQQPLQSSWSPTSYATAQWSNNAFAEGFTSRPVASYGQEAALSVPPQDSRPTSEHVQEAPQGHDAYRNQLHGVHEVEQTREGYPLATEFSAPPNAPPFLPNTQRSAPVAHLLNYPTQPIASLHVDLARSNPQLPMAWPADPSSDTPSAQHPYLSDQTNVTPSSAMVASNPGTDSNPGWIDLNGGLSSAVSPTLEQLPASHSDSGYVQTQSDVAASLDVPARRMGKFPPRAPPRHSATSTTASRNSQRGSTAKKKRLSVPSPFVVRQEKMKIVTRKGPLTMEDKENAHYNRKNGICTRCKFYKVRCSPGTPCERCSNTGPNARVFLEPCSRDHVEEQSLVRRCNGHFNQIEAEFLRYSWKEGGNFQVMEIALNLPGFTPVCTTQPIQIHIGEYRQEGTALDTTQSVWQNTNNQFINVRQPPYAAYDPVALQEAINAHVLCNLPSVEQWIFDRNRYDDLALLTYQEAVRLRGSSELLDLALQLQCVSVVSQGYGSVWSNNIPGIQEYDFRVMGKSGYEAYDRNQLDRPLPVALQHQCDVALVKLATQIEGKFKKVITQKIFQPSSHAKPWYELMLTLFVVMWNLEYIHSGAEGYIKSKVGTGLEAQVNHVVRQQIDKWTLAFDVLLYHWRMVVRNYRPFAMARDNPQELRDKGRLPDDQAFDYMMRASAILRRTGPDQFAPPVTGVTGPQISLASKWITALFRSASE